MAAQFPVVSGAVEGPVDDAVLRRILREAGALSGTIYTKEGKSQLLRRVAAYNHAARLGPWVVLLDLDRDSECAPSARRKILPQLEANLCLRFAVREIEAWLLADRDRFAAFFGVALSKVPQQPETLLDPKRKIVDLARSSRKKDIQRDLVPRPESGREVGPAYTSRLIEYVHDPKRGWRPEVAAEQADSLRRCLKCVERLISRAASGGLPESR